MVEAINAADEPVYTVDELAHSKKLHPSTVRKLFLDETGVIRLGHGRRRGRRQYYTLRIPHSVAERVFRRLTVGWLGDSERRRDAAMPHKQKIDIAGVIRA
jgi:hypothetical protein